MSRTNSDPASDARRLRMTIADMGRRRSLRDPLFTACEAMNLTPPQFHTILWLGLDGALRMGDLSRRLGISEKTMTGLIDRLEKSGLVQRVRDEADRRVVRVRLSKKGTSTYEKLDADMDQKLTLILSLLDPGDRQSLLAIFDKLLHRLSEAAPGPAQRSAAGT